MKKKFAFISVIILVLLLGIFLSGNNKFSFGTSDSEENKASPAVSGKISVKVQEAQLIKKASVKTYKATLEPFEEGLVSSKASGKVVEVLFENGDAVKQGDVLVRLDGRDIENQLDAAETQLAVSKANLQKLEANLELAEQNYRREKELYAEGATTKASLDNAELTLKMARADVATANKNIELAQVNIDTLRDNLADTVIKAPINGLVDEKTVNVGQFVSPGTVLGKVKQITPIYAVIEVNQTDLNLIKIGQKARVKVDGSKNTFEGTVRTMDVSANPSSRVFECKILLDNPDRFLKPGIFAKAEILSGQEEEVIMLPIAALAGNEGSYYVFANENGVARKRNISIGDITDDLVEIKSGIEKGEAVIITNVNMLQDGDAVTVIAE